MQGEPAESKARRSPLCGFVVFALFWYTLAYLFPRDPRGMQPVEGAFPVWLSLGRDAVWVVLFLAGIVAWARQWRAEGRASLPLGRIGRALFWVFAATAGLGLILAALHTSHRPISDVLRYDVRDLLMYGGMLLIAGAWLRSRAQIHCWMCWFVGAAIAVGLLGYIQTYVFPTTRFEHRAFSTLSNANNFGFVMCLLLTLAAVNIDASKPPNQWKWWGAAALSIGCILLSQSLGALIFMVACLFVVTILSQRRRTVAISLLAAVACGVITALPAKAPIELSRKIAGNLGARPSRISVQKRQADLASAAAVTTVIANAPPRWCTLAFGDWESRELIRHEPVFLRSLRNSGALVTLGLIILVAGSGGVAVRKGLLLRHRGLQTQASLVGGIGLFLVLAFLTLLQFTPFLYRFPVNFLLYTLCAIALYYPMVDPVTEGDKK